MITVQQLIDNAKAIRDAHPTAEQAAAGIRELQRQLNESGQTLKQLKARVSEEL